MANNRMFLVCPECREIIMLGKNMARGWYSAPEEKDLGDFYFKHEGCGILEKPFKFASEDEDTWKYGNRTKDGINTIEWI